ncbi:MAG: ABC transporter ATP-binding protein [Actinomycetaceae bacterium]|nr:ABC transporter ATP-binding protein [Actinomycetaceae bacterium]
MKAQTQPTALTLQSVTKSFGTTTAVDSIDITITEGEVVALLGPNGAGKSTTIEMILSLLTPDSGTVTVNGVSPQQAAANGSVGAMLQTGALLEDLRVSTMLHLMADLHGAQERLAVLIDELGVTDLMKRRVRKCSGGERQRLRLVMALLSEPSLLILDEPTAGLDPTARRKFWEAMSEQARSGRTIVFATHYLEEAEEFAQRTIIMNKGCIVADGPTSEVRSIASIQHLQAAIPENMWLHYKDQILTLTGDSAHVDYANGQLRMTGPAMREVAQLLLSIPEAHGIELTNTSLDDAFSQLTEAASLPTNAQ